MRPVNLIPPEQRRGDRAPLRSGPLAYVLVGALGAALLAVTGLVMTQNSITDRENEVAQLEVTSVAAAERAQALAPYAEFAALQDSRRATITSLAQSRFDWERVMRELALVIPSDVSLSELVATADSTEDAQAAAAGPTLTMTGCGQDQTAVARFIAALEDIDGVTRVALVSSESAGSGNGESQAGAGECSSDPKLAAFELNASFEGVAATAIGPSSPPAPSTVPAETNSQEEQVDQADQATGLVPGVAK